MCTLKTRRDSKWTMIVVFKYLHDFLVENSLDLSCAFQRFGTKTNRWEKRGGKDGSSLVKRYQNTEALIWEAINFPTFEVFKNNLKNHVMGSL